MQQTISITRQGRTVIKPLKSKVLSLAGVLKGKKPRKKLKIEKIRDYIDYWQC